MNTLGITRKHYASNHLRTLLDGFVEFEGADFADGQVTGLTQDSRMVEKGNLFLACSGSRSADRNKPVDHGIAYAGQAIRAGAQFIAWEPTDEINDMPVACRICETQSIPLIRVENLHQKQGLIAARYYKNPSEVLTMIGVTGTNGKTSTTHFIVQILHLLKNNCINNVRNSEKKSCALIGTLGNGIYPQLHDSTHTTPDAIQLQKLLAEFREQAVDTVVMEVSSHALSQNRVTNVLFDIAVFTNLSRDHLDYHGDMQKYAHEKLKLFQFPSLRHIILNADDEFSSEISQALINSKHTILRVSQQDPNADLFAEHVRLTHSGLVFELNYQQHKYLLKANLVGQFNVDNLLSAIAVVIALGYDIKDIVPTLEKLLTVPGRMEMISNECQAPGASRPMVIVDYAHTPDALEKALISLRAHCTSRLICVFGCGGDRDKGKRPQMANAAERYADRIIVTADNPRNEPIDAIIADIVSGFQNNNDYEVITDRTSAIQKAIQNSSSGDVVLIAGKGHEEFQEINGMKRPFSDKEVVRNVLCNMENN